MFFSKPDIFPACGLYNLKHLISVIMLIFLIVVGVKKIKINKKEDITKIIKVFTIIVWILEIIKIIFNLFIGNINNVNTYVPLYYCSILLYAGILSGFAKGKLKRIGDIFLATGGLFAGICFLISPGTSLGIYPLFHFISFQSLFYHAVMIYLGVIIIKYNYVDVKISDFKYYAFFIAIICALAYVVNINFSGNLMFINNGFGLFTIFKKIFNQYYCLMMIIGQITIPFFLGLIINKIIKSLKF